MPIRQLQRVITYEENTDRREPGKTYGGYKCLTQKDKSGIDVQQALTLIMNVDIDEGNINGNYDITDEVKVKGRKTLDFTQVDNNDGITIIDVRKYPIKYCFLFLSGQHKEIMMKPLSAEGYFKKYEDSYLPGGHYSKCMDSAQAAIAYVQEHAQLLTTEQLIKMFPLSMKGVADERKLITATKFEDLPTIIGEKITYPVNRELVSQRLGIA